MSEDRKIATTEELRERLNDAYTAFHKTTEDKTIGLAVLRIVDIATEALRLAGAAGPPPQARSGASGANHPASAPATPGAEEMLELIPGPRELPVTVGHLSEASGLSLGFTLERLIRLERKGQIIGLTANRVRRAA